MDAVLDAHDRVPAIDDPPTTPLGHADWAYQRCGAIAAMIRSRAAGTAPAALARGLLEEAAFWDWALANDASSEWVHRLALDEYERLRSRADPTDCIWLQWVLAPGAEVRADGQGLPKSADMVKRLGHGFTAALLEPLTIGGLFGIYKLIELITHGAAATAMLFDAPGGCEMADEISAAVLHVSGAGAAAVVVSWLPCEADQVDSLARASRSLADAACLVHRFPMGPRIARRGAKPRRARPDSDSYSSIIEHLPAPSAAIIDAAARYVKGAERVHRVIADLPLAPEITGLEPLAAATLRLATAHLMVLRAAVEGTVGQAFVPAAARALFEDGARWGWLRATVATAGPTGAGIQSMLADTQRYLRDARDWMSKEGLPASSIEHMLRPAGPLLDGDFVGPGLPSIEDMIASTFAPADGGTEWALPMYGLLSQFVHYSPIGTLHVQFDRFPSVSAPMFAVAAQAACHGHFLVLLSTTSILYGNNRLQANSALEDLASAVGALSRLASGIHFLD